MSPILVDPTMRPPRADAARPIPPVVEGVLHRFVETPRLRVHIAEAGEGEPVLLLNGWPQDWYAWRKSLSRFSDKPVSPDTRGERDASATPFLPLAAVQHVRYSSPLCGRPPGAAVEAQPEEVSGE